MIAYRAQPAVFRSSRGESPSRYLRHGKVIAFDDGKDGLPPNPAGVKSTTGQARALCVWSRQADYRTCR